MKNKYLYISGYSNIKSKNANLTNVLYTTNALKEYSKKIILIIFVPLNFIFKAKKEIALIDNQLNINLITIPFFKIRPIYFLYDLVCFFLGILYYKMGYKIYTRDCRLAIWLYKFRCRNIAIEIHDCSKRSILSYQYCKYAYFFPISKGIIEELRNLNLKRNIKELPDAAILACSTNNGYLNLEKKNIVYVGSSAIGKGIKTIKELAIKNNHLNFHIVGYIKNSDKTLEKIPNLKLHGFKNKMQIAEFLIKSDLLIAPYEKKVIDNAGNQITNYMSPLKIFEYMASKTPFIVSRMKFITDFLVEDIHCMMANPEDIEEWSYKINLFFNNPKIFKKMAEKSYQLYKRNYTWQKRAEIINTFFNA